MKAQSVNSGQVFGRWTVIKQVKNNKYNSRQHQCKCICGSIRIVRTSSLLNGDSTSCGCYIKEITAERSTTHGQSHTKIYKTWNGLRDRCMNLNNKDYSYYGGRGITVCERWKIFENFLEDMGHPPTNNHTLDRIDNNKGYYKENCRWTTYGVQASNRDYTSVYRMWEYVTIRCPACKKLTKMQYIRARKKINSVWIAVKPYCCEVMEYRDTEEWYKLLDTQINHILKQQRIVKYHVSRT